ncbi:MAG: hypothetical protein KDA97_04245 [Acidimicrobiales bacterium]|nr:hypothetical protein [Acidimicrobiales bacterium]
MKWFLLWFLGTIGALIVVACIVVLFVRHRMQRRLRVDPARPTSAPLHWLADPRAPARLHRRLARVGRAATAVADDHRPPRRRLRRSSAEEPPLVGVAESLRDQAVRLDHEIARVSVLHKAVRADRLVALEGAVADVEQASATLVSLSAEVHTPPVLATDDADIVDAAAQVARLAEAHRALLAIDEASGLVSGTGRTTASGPSVGRAGPTAS